MLMEEYADGVLDQQAAGLVSSHMGACADCASFYTEIAREQEIYARYQRDIEITPVLWSSIESRIKQERAARPAGLLSRLGERLVGLFAAPRLSPAFAAALVIVAIGITVAVMTLWNSRGSGELAARGNKNEQVETAKGVNDSTTQPPPSNAPEKAPDKKELAISDMTPAIKASKAPSGPKLVAAAPKPTPEQLVREAEQKYLSAIALLSRDVNRNRSQLDPIMLARFDAALGDIDRTIKDTRRLVRENPGDPIALQYLLAAYSKKVDVLREMTLTEN